MHPALISLQAAFEGVPVVSRFAPSVTGYLHMGHLVNAVYVWGITRALGGKIILRLEDHDRTRFRPEFEAALLKDLKLLGLKWDIPAPDAFSSPTPFRQSDQPDRYAALLAHLRTQAHVYACTCSRKSLEARTGPTPEDHEQRYDGHCRFLNQTFQDAIWRVVLPDREVSFLDHRMGWQTQHPQQQCGDLALTDRHGQYTYQFCVVADDWAQGVNLVIRGEDILASTGRQIMMHHLLGHRDRMHYLHHGLLVGPDGRKLSKKDFSEPIHLQLQLGVPPQVLLGKAAYLAGLTKEDRPIDAGDLEKLFNY